MRSERAVSCGYVCRSLSWCVSARKLSYVRVAANAMTSAHSEFFKEGKNEERKKERKKEENKINKKKARNIVL